MKGYFHVLTFFSVFIYILYYTNFYHYFSKAFTEQRSETFSITGFYTHNISANTTERYIKEIRTYNKSKVNIVFYTPFFGQRPWKYFHLKKNYSQECGYELEGCEISYDTRSWKTADIIFFHARDMPKFEVLMDMKESSPNGQLWAYFVRESPLNAPPVQAIDHFFELAASYRYDSDFSIPYGSYRKLTHQEISNIEKFKNYTFNVQNESNLKTRQIAWIASNCNSKRDKLAHRFEDLGLHIEVGGGCSRYFKKKMKCKGQSCFDQLKKYKFYFSAENTLCDKYVTEKYWRNALEFGLIPITLGGSNYSDPKMTIPGSYINAFDFHSPKELVEYIKKVDANDTLYNQYFEWKKKYKVVVEQPGCSVSIDQFCKQLHHKLILRKYPLLSNINIAKDCLTADRFFNLWIKR